MERERQIFGSCVGLTPAERTAYLDRECLGDTVLRQRLDRLLHAHALATTGVAGLRDIPLDDIPDLIGRYRLHRIIGEGGMGTVYEAEQLEPVQRMVALKVVKFGGRAVISRFATERQALAVMDHPNVAKVFDAGETLLGRPYFVMELVRGASITEYCDAHSLSVQDRLRLFLQLCHAVQHAHQKGVIHRDLKPSNVLVSDEPGKPIAKVIDFGIAKALLASASSPEWTKTDHPVGTPAYMSPEQAGGVDIDTRSDIYSLGVILYELLGGALPADPAELGYASFLVQLTRGELKIAPLTGRLAAANRRSSVDRGDLDCIVTRAMEADRSRRYPSADALADDIGRCLRQETINARPPTLSYRLAKLIRRNRFHFAAAVIAVVALALGAIASTAGYLRAKRAEATSRQEAATAHEVSDFLVELFSLPDPNRAPGSPLTAKELLDKGASKVEKELGGQPRVQADLLSTLSHVYDSLGQYPRAMALAEKALSVSESAKLREDDRLADALLVLGRVKQRQGEFEGARKAYERALEIRIRLQGENDLEVARVLNNLGSLYGQLEKFDQSVAAHRRALAIQRRAGGPEHISTYNSLRGIGLVQDRKGEWQAALDSFREAQVILEKRYGGSHPLVADNLNDQARMLWRMNKLSESRQLYEHALEIQKRALGPDNPAVAYTEAGLGRVLEAEEKLGEAIAMQQDAARITEAALGPNSVRLAPNLKSLGRL
ncbi:MAG: serine/threonine-protein kinase, partial [Bryobacteraceae bacterium]